MDAVGNKKMLNMLILNVLKKYSDEEHRLTQQEIMRILLADYETECDRRSVKNNVLYLKELGYDINMDDGYYLATREFENEEIQFLIDCIANAHTRKFSKKKTKILLDKLVAQGNKYFEPKEPVVNEEAEIELTIEQPVEIKIEQAIEVIEETAPIAEAAPEIKIEKIESREIAEDDNRIHVRFLAPKNRQEEYEHFFGEDFKLMATHKEKIEFLAGGGEEELFLWALRNCEVEVLSPDNFRDRLTLQVQAMSEKYTRRAAGFFRKSIW